MKYDHKSFSGAYRSEAADRVARFVPMVRRLAWHLNGTGRAGIELEDLMQAGMVALTEAAQRHAGPTEDGFAAYAKVRVKGAMVDLIRRQVPLSRGASERRRQLARCEAELAAQLGRQPSAAEVATVLGLTEHQVEAMRDRSVPIQLSSLDEIYTDADPAFADDRPDSLALLEDAELRACVADAIAQLPERQQLVIQLYFVEELNLSEIAAALQVSIPRVHQIKAQAIDKLRTALADGAIIL